MNDERRNGDDGDEPIGRGHYGPDALDEVTVPATDPVREAKDHDVQDPADVPVDPEELRNGGPTRNPGMRTTTGSTAGPGGPGRPGRPGHTRPPGRDEVAEQTAPTTTGDATSRGMGTPVGGGTSDATAGGATSGGSSTDR